MMLLDFAFATAFNMFIDFNFGTNLVALRVVDVTLRQQNLKEHKEMPLEGDCHLKD